MTLNGNTDANDRVLIDPKEHWMNQPSGVGRRFKSTTASHAPPLYPLFPIGYNCSHVQLPSNEHARFPYRGRFQMHSCCCREHGASVQRWPLTVTTPRWVRKIHNFSPYHEMNKGLDGRWTSREHTKIAYEARIFKCVSKMDAFVFVWLS